MAKPRFLAGGDDDDAPALSAQDGPRRLRYPCAAHGCRLPGALFIGGDGVCGWHAREAPNDWPKITRTLADWECAMQAINAARQCMTDADTCASPKLQDERMAAAWARMLPAVLGSGWHRRVEPKPGERFGDWGRRLEVFLGARVKEALGQGLAEGSRIDEGEATPFVAEVRGGLRDGKRGNVADQWDGP